MTAAQQLAYDQSAATSEGALRCWALAVETLGKPAVLVDVGCGPGHIVEHAAAVGVRAYGADISLPEQRRDTPQDAHLMRVDLTLPWVAPERGDMVLCLEVAEHLPASAAYTLCATLARACTSAGTLLFSAATPGQGGAGHVNEREHEYWTCMLSAHGFEMQHDLTAMLRVMWSDAAPDAWWYGKNLLVMRGAQ